MNIRTLLPVYQLDQLHQFSAYLNVRRDDALATLSAYLQTVCASVPIFAGCITAVGVVLNRSDCGFTSATANCSQSVCKFRKPFWYQVDD
jgi:hypothetical protein